MQKSTIYRLSFNMKIDWIPPDRPARLSRLSGGESNPDLSSGQGFIIRGAPKGHEGLICKEKY